MTTREKSANVLETRLQNIETAINKKDDYVKDSLEELLKRTQKIEVISQDLLDLKAAVQYISDENEVLQKNQEQLEAKLADMSAKQCESERIIEELKIEISRVCNSVIEDNYFQREKKIVIKGITLNSKQNPADIILDLAFRVNLKLLRDDLAQATRLSRRDGSTLIKAEFATVDKKREFVKLVRKKRLSTKDLGFPGTSSQIYVDEDLHPLSRKLFYAALQKKKELNFRFLWIKSGKIFLKQSESTTPFMINKLQDLDVIKKL